MWVIVFLKNSPPPASTVFWWNLCHLVQVFMSWSQLIRFSNAIFLCTAPVLGRYGNMRPYALVRLNVAHATSSIYNKIIVSCCVFCWYFEILWSQFCRLRSAQLLCQLIQFEWELENYPSKLTCNVTSV